MISTFIKLLFEKEFKLLLGKKCSSLFFLVLIIFFSLFTIGISDGIKKYLSKKMEDPSVNFIMVEVPTSNPKFNKKKSDVSLKQLKHPDRLSQYNYEDVSVVYEGFVNLSSGIQIKYRLVEEDDVFFDRYVKKEIISPEQSRLQFYDDEYGCIISENLKNLIDKKRKQNNLNYNFESSPFLNVMMGENRIAPIRVLGVISGLPNDNDIIITKKLFDAYNSQNEIVFDINHNNHKTYLNVFSLDEIDEQNDRYSFYKISDDNYSNGSFYEVYRQNPIDTISFDELYSVVSENHDLIRVYDYNYVNVDPFENTYIDYINFSFNNLDSVRVFKNYLKDTYNLKLDISTVEAKENFNLFDKISRFLSIALVVFSVILILSHLLNILMSHLDKNQKSIGTLKAFGLSNQKIILLYSLLSLLLISISFLISYILLLITSQPLMNILINNFISSGNEIVFQMFDLHNVILFFVISPSLVVFIMLYNRLNKSTPGDLIYKR